MSNKEERKAPVLRFKGFTDDWEQRKLGDIAKRVIRKNKENDILPVLTNSADLGIVLQNDYFDKAIAKNLNNYYMVSHNDFVYNPRISKKAPFGPINRNKLNIQGVMSPLYLVFRFNSEMDLNFLEYYFQSSKWHPFMYKNGDSGARADRFAIKNSVLMNMTINVPTLDQQKRIGKILLLLENSIALQQRKLDQLKQLKKAYLSDLFSIKNKPQIRFKGFKGKWKKSKLLDNVSNIIDFRGKTPKKLGMDWSDQGILALSALNVKDSFIDKSIHAHYGDIKLYNKWMAGNKLHKGQVLFTTEAPMGNVAQVPDNDKYILSQRTIAFNVNKDKISDSFLAMLLQTTTVHNQLLSLSSGGTAKGVSQKSLSGLSVVIPLSLEEQRKMEMAFKYINHLIHFQQDKIRYLEENKQFLLQNMFI